MTAHSGAPQVSPRSFSPAMICGASASLRAVDSLPEPFRGEMRALYREMAARETPEAKLYKALDNLEAVIQHNESDLSTWSENEFSLNLVYGYDKAAWSPVLLALRDAVREETEARIEEYRKEQATC